VPKTDNFYVGVNSKNAVLTSSDATAPRQSLAGRQYNTRSAPPSISVDNCLGQVPGKFATSVPRYPRICRGEHRATLQRRQAPLDSNLILYQTPHIRIGPLHGNTPSSARSTLSVYRVNQSVSAVLLSPFPAQQTTAASGCRCFISHAVFGYYPSLHPHPMSSPTFSASFGLFTAIGALAIYATLVLVRRSRSLPFPPGPRPELLIGNARQMASGDLEVLFEQWGKLYGECDVG
jgi:hypothetical protein